MIKCALVVGVLALAGASALGAQSGTTELEAIHGLGNVDRTTQAEDVRFRSDRADRMTVPVRLSGSGPYHFLVDTGADRTAVSRQIADKLQLQRGASLSMHSVTGVSTVATAAVPSLQLTRRDLKVARAPLLEAADMGADGILGVDSLRSQRVLFDFETDTMSIMPSANSRHESSTPDTIVVRANSKRGRLILTKAKANGHALSVVLDTGSQVSIGNAALRKALLRTRQLDGSRMVDLQSVTGGTIRGEYMFIKSLEIGGVELKNLAVVFANAHTFNLLDLDRKPALLLGMNGMRAFKKVSIDFAQRKLRVVLPEESALGVRVADSRRLSRAKPRSRS
jgi:predicted aspartyl protease